MGVEITGEKELLRLLNDLPEKAHRRAIRKGVSAGSQEIVKQARRNAKEIKETGALAKGMTKKVITTSDKKIIGMAGANKNVELEGRKPSRYLHLVEFGHIDRAGNYVPGKRILSRAAESTQGQQLAKFEAKTKDAIDKETEKLARAYGAK